MRRFNYPVFFWVFAAVLAITTLWAHLLPRVYESTGVLQRIRIEPVIMVDDHNADKMRTRLTDSIPTSETIDWGAVVRRMTAADRAEMLKPYGYTADAGTPIITSVLKRNLRVTPLHMSFLFKISYRHPDPRLALLVSEIIVDEWMAHCARAHAVEVVEYLAELREIRDAKMKRAISEREEITQALAALQKGPAGVVEARSESTNTGLNADMLRNAEWLKSIDVDFEKKTMLAHEMPLRILDRPVLADVDQYVHSPIMKILRWRLLISAMIGLLAAMLVERRKAAI